MSSLIGEKSSVDARVNKRCGEEEIAKKTVQTTGTVKQDEKTAGKK